jgi:hypothetical protein
MHDAICRERRPMLSTTSRATADGVEMKSPTELFASIRLRTVR